MNNEPRKDRAHIKAMALGVAQSWLCKESHLEGEFEDRYIAWAEEAQRELASMAEQLGQKYANSSKTLRR